MCCLRVVSANQAEWDISCQNPEGLPEQPRHGTVACIAAGARSWCATKQGKAFTDSAFECCGLGIGLLARF